MINNVSEKQIPLEYTMAYVEILEILNRMSKTDYNKIPSELIEKFNTFKNSDYEFKYDDNKELKDQKLMQKTKDILAVLLIDYLASEEDKKYIAKKQDEFKLRKEKASLKKYNPDDLFKKSTQKNITEEYSNENLQLIEVSEQQNIFKKIFNYIVNIFK